MYPTMRIRKGRKTHMLNLNDIIKFNCKSVRVLCCDNDVYAGKCYVYSELNDDDEIEEYITVSNVHIPLEDIAEISEISGG